MSMYQRVQVVLKIPAYQLELYYDGTIDTVAAKTTDGRIIHFSRQRVAFSSTKSWRVWYI